jgi:hypothetical protein
MVEWLTLLLRIGVSLFQAPARIPAILTEDFRDFSQFLHENAGIVP